jgi:hypothetical protein
MSHTMKVIAVGFALLAVCLVAARLIASPAAAPAFVARAALVFIGLWLIGAGINMWYGVSRAGYSVSEEAPFFLVVWAVPSSVALWVWWRYSH